MNYKENKQVLLALFITLILMATTIFTYSQTTINPDTVCMNANNESYFVTNTPTSTYVWTITNGVVSSGQGSNAITIDYTGVASGLYPNLLEIIESNAAGCPGSPIYLDVYILNLQFPQIGPFCTGDPTTTFGGTPLTGVYTDAAGNVITSFNPSTYGVGNHDITYTLGGCITTITVVVNTGPVTGNIFHY
ncbi:MAG: hypothetical protein H8E55_10575 [Pelagibacterales bacterium]|nr:hypothetical protein [Pelagibacterales bacterium]